MLLSKKAWYFDRLYVTYVASDYEVKLNAIGFNVQLESYKPLFWLLNLSKAMILKVKL